MSVATANRIAAAATTIAGRVAPSIGSPHSRRSELHASTTTPRRQRDHRDDRPQRRATVHRRARRVHQVLRREHEQIPDRGRLGDRHKGRDHEVAGGGPLDPDLADVRCREGQTAALKGQNRCSASAIKQIERGHEHRGHRDQRQR